MKTMSDDRQNDDPVNHPAHYHKGGFEVIDVIEAYALPYHLGNVVKYILRHQYKGKPLQDLQKALWYLLRYVEDQEDLATLEERKDEAASKNLFFEPKTDDYDPVEQLTTYEEAMTDPGLCPFIDVVGYVHGVQCGCSVVVPTVTNWPGATEPAAWYPGTPAQAHEDFTSTLKDASDTTYVNLPLSERVGGQDVPHVYDAYYGFNRDEVITKCAQCKQGLTAEQAYLTVGQQDFCSREHLNLFRGENGL